MKHLSICQCIIEELKEQLNSETFLSEFRTGKHFLRKRLLSMKQVVFFLLYSTKRSMNLDLSSIQEDLISIDFPSVSKQAVSKARKGICPKLFHRLFQHAVERFYDRKENFHTWNGYRLFAIDGTRLQVPRNQDNIEYFGCARNSKARILTTMASASLLYDINHDIIVDAVIKNFDYAERKAAACHLTYLEQQDMCKNAVILCDRGYPSYEFYKRISEAGYFFVMRIQEKVYSLTRSDSEDMIRDFAPSYLKGADPVKVRVVKIPLEDEKTEYLVTNLFDETITPAMLKELYFLRWGIEGKYMELKSRLELETFTGACHTSVEQEFFITLLLSNLSSILKQDVDEEIKRQTDMKNNKYKYQANRSYIIGSLKRALCPMLCGERNIYDQLQRIYSEAVKRRSQIRPGRKYERPRVQLQRKHFNNRKTCM